MTEQLKSIINRLEHHIQLAHEEGGQDAFVITANEICDELETMENSLDAIDPILELIERNPGIDYGDPGPLAHFMETYYNKGYEELLLRSIERKPTEYTLHLLHRLINGEENPKRQFYLDVMKRISISEEYPENIIENAKDSLSYF